MHSYASLLFIRFYLHNKNIELNGIDKQQFKECNPYVFVGTPTAMARPFAWFTVTEMGLSDNDTISASIGHFYIISLHNNVL